MMRIAAVAWLAACGGKADSSDAAPADEARPTVAASPPAAPAPAEGRAATPAPEPSAADSAAAAREDVSPEWKLSERSMAAYDDCMAQAGTMPDAVRARLEAACRTRSGAP